MAMNPYRGVTRRVSLAKENRTPEEGGTKDPTVNPHLSVAAAEARKGKYRKDPDPDCHLCCGTGEFQMRHRTATCACSMRTPELDEV